MLNKNSFLSFEDTFLVKLEELKHKHRIEALSFIRETERLKHEFEKERMRIKSAEIRKSIEAKQRLRDFDSLREQ